MDDIVVPRAGGYQAFQVVIFRRSNEQAVCLRPPGVAVQVVLEVGAAFAVVSDSIGGPLVTVVQTHKPYAELGNRTAG